MKSVFVFFTTFLLIGMASAAEIKTTVGIVTQQNADQALTYALGASVHLLSSRVSYDPFALIGIIETRIIEILVDDVHLATCDFRLVKNEARVIINDCSSKTASIYFRGFISFSSLGIDRPTY